jgi:hypothetical protein
MCCRRRISATRLRLTFEMPRWMHLKQHVERLPGSRAGLQDCLRCATSLSGPLGLKSGADESLPASGRVGIFPVVSSSSERVVLGFDDTHLNFRIIVDVKALDETTRRITATTLVHRNNLFGRVYLATVMPFHKLIVPTMLARVGNEADQGIVQPRLG